MRFPRSTMENGCYEYTRVPAFRDVVPIVDHLEPGRGVGALHLSSSSERGGLCHAKALEGSRDAAPVAGFLTQQNALDAEFLRFTVTFLKEPELGETPGPVCRSRPPRTGPLRLGVVAASL
jgi:hypothetical protein